jgi:transcriptional regulator with XRE-family HTH domain
MEDRLVQLLKSEGINPTRFAERIGVQRSSMSHILSGRNKPSFDFIVKILESFPSVNPDWLLLGKGSMYKGDAAIQPGLFDSLNQDINHVVNNITPESNSRIKDEDKAKYDRSNKNIDLRTIETENNRVDSSKKIDKIVILFSDKTFSDYLPNT